MAKRQISTGKVCTTNALIITVIVTSCNETVIVATFSTIIPCSMSRQSLLTRTLVGCLTYAQKRVYLVYLERIKNVQLDVAR